MVRIVIILILFESAESVLRVMIFETFVVSRICSNAPWDTALVWLSTTAPGFRICTLPSELKCRLMWSEIIETLELFMMIALLWCPLFYLFSVDTLDTSLLFHLLIESERLMCSGRGRGFLVAALEVIIPLYDRLPAREKHWGRRFSPHTRRRRRTILLLFLWLVMRDRILKLVIIVLLTFFLWIFCVVRGYIDFHLLNRH